MASDPLYFVHISDTHIGPTADFGRPGHHPLPCAQRLVEIINTLPTRPDFVIHTGDVVNNPEPATYQLAAELFAQLHVPIYYATGNHDTSAGIRRHLPMGPMQYLSDDPNLLCYAFEQKGYRFLVLDGHGPTEIDPHGLLSEAELAIVRRETPTDGPPLVIFIHYPALPVNSPWMDNNALILNGEELHQLLRPAAGRLRGVFHGHIHQAIQVTRDGILYVSVASAFSQFAAWPVDIDVRFDPEHLPGYGFVHLLPTQTIIHQHTFPRPE
jgi:3',5'-cyclic-AMP phosphodiesterase